MSGWNWRTRATHMDEYMGRFSWRGLSCGRQLCWGKTCTRLLMETECMSVGRCLQAHSTPRHLTQLTRRRCFCLHLLGTRWFPEGFCLCLLLEKIHPTELN